MKLTIAEMLKALANGEKVTRESLNKGSYIFLDEDGKIKTNTGVEVKSLDANADDWKEYNKLHHVSCCINFNSHKDPLWCDSADMVDLPTREEIIYQMKLEYKNGNLGKDVESWYYEIYDDDGNILDSIEVTREEALA